VTSFRYRDHVSWNTSKIISRLINLRFMLGLTQLAIWCNGNTPNGGIGVGQKHKKTCNISETVQDWTKVTMTY